ncbi:MAG: TlpA disulfide reductase family protein [Pseudomonadota bacterium]|nr:TlpA disulfide reductase family protein [Pseudomonadota bacterium]
MKKYWRISLLVTAISLTSGCQDATIEVDGGGVFEERDWRGRWTLVNYWAEWCGPCRDEIPELNEIQKMGTKLGVQVVGVNYDGVTGQALASLIKTMGIKFPVLLKDPRVRWELAAPSILPTTLLINPNGELVTILIGPQTVESLLEAVGAAQISSANVPTPVLG